MEKYLGWIAVPNIALIIVTLQGLGFFMVTAEPAWRLKLALLPEAVRAGEFWRLITFLSLPLSDSLIFVVLTLWFLYFVLTSIESQWGSFKTTLYVLVSFLLTITFSMVFNYPILEVSHFESTLFLAAAALFPEYEIRLFLFIPAKMKWLAWVSALFILLRLYEGDWMDRLYLTVMYSNFLLFFGPAFVSRARTMYRQWSYKKKLR